MPTLQDLISRLDQARKITAFHEPDTIERLIVPVLVLAGWNTDSLNPMFLQRGNRDMTSDHRRFDLQLFSSDTAPRIVIECKDLSASLAWEGKGWSQDASDYLRQLRDYCASPKFTFRKGWTQPIVSNGDTWILLTDAFIETPELAGGLTAQNKTKFIRAECRLAEPQFSQTIINVIKYSTANQASEVTARKLAEPQG